LIKKVAIFVEGLTEQIFTKKLIGEMAGNKNITIKESKYHGKQIVDLLLTDHGGEEESKCFVLIMDCEGDHQVKSAILDRRDALIKSGYELVVGLRDLYPTAKDKYSELMRGLMTRVPTKGLPIHFVVSVMETESWFIQEWNHYQKIDAELTLDRIINETSFNPESDDAADIAEPAKFLNTIYEIVNKSYVKEKASLQRTVEALDYDNLYENVRGMLPQLNQFITHIDSFV